MKSIPKEYNFELVSEVRYLCNSKKYFTSGDLSQYDKLFTLVKSEVTSARDIAFAIWMCSTGKELSDIYDDVMELEIRILDEVRFEQEEHNLEQYEIYFEDSDPIRQSAL